VPVDKVQLSREAQAALRESVEKPEQTAREAGDAQSKRQLAQQEAARESSAKEESASAHVVA
jgi:hypothetical protein